MVRVNDLHDFYLVTATPQLTANMKGGSHALKMTNSHIILSYIQDTIYSKTRLPSGKFIDNPSMIKDLEIFWKRTRYHATIPVVYQYTFDREKSSLKLKTYRLKQRAAQEQKFIRVEGGRGYPQKLRDLSTEDVNKVFPFKAVTYDYPQCEPESFFSVKRFVRFFFKLLYFI